jgi:uncharacterized protein YjbI with pentapeptide repeats
MNESETKNEKPEEERRFSQEQYDMLKRCSDKKDITEWNEWRKKHPDEDILLERADLSQRYLKGALLNAGGFKNVKTGEFTEFRAEVHLEGAILEGSHLEHADLIGAHLQDAIFYKASLREADLRLAHLEDAILWEAHFEGANLNYAHVERGKLDQIHMEKVGLEEAHLEGAVLYEAYMEGANWRMAIVDGSTLIWECKVDSDTDFRGVGLDSARIDSGTKQLLEYNIRQMNWEGWYKGHHLLRWPVWLFWLISDYGLRTWRVIATFFGLAIVFGVVYWLWPSCVMVNNVVGDIRGFWHALYFSVVTMTTLGFGDIAANPDSWGGQTLLMLQVILGYVLLGALVTRFAVLFTAGGPAGTFSKEKKK